MNIIEQLKKAYPNGVTLHYIDRGDNLDDHKELIEQIIQGNTDPVYDKIFERYIDAPEAVDYIARETFENRDDLDDEQQQEAVDRIRENDTSDIYTQLLNNTNDQMFWYDLDYYMEGNSRNWEEKEIYQEGKKIAKIAGIPYTKKNKEALYYIVAQATYGGNLGFMRYGSIDDVMNGDKLVIGGSIELGVVDCFNGSGDVGTIVANKTMKLDRSKLEIETNRKYNRSEDIAGIHYPAYNHNVYTE